MPVIALDRKYPTDRAESHRSALGGAYRRRVHTDQQTKGLLGPARPRPALASRHGLDEMFLKAIDQAEQQGIKKARQRTPQTTTPGHLRATLESRPVGFRERARRQPTFQKPS